MNFTDFRAALASATTDLFAVAYLFGVLSGTLAVKSRLSDEQEREADGTAAARKVADWEIDGWDGVTINEEAAAMDGVPEKYRDSYYDGCYHGARRAQQQIRDGLAV